MCRPIVCVVHILTMLQRKSCYINIFHVKMPYKLNRPICCSRYYDKQQQLSKQITSDSFYSLFLFFSTSRCKTGDTRIPLSLMHFNKGFFLSRILRYLVSVTDEIRVQLREGHTGVCNALLTYSLLIFQPRSRRYHNLARSKLGTRDDKDLGRIVWHSTVGCTEGNRKNGKIPGT